jgi:hypothetical protein
MCLPKFCKYYKTIVILNIDQCLPYSAAFAKATSKAQDFLEADPHWEQKDIPMQLFKAKEPFVGKVVSVKRVVGPQAVGETCDIIIDHQGKMPYWEGQSYGVIPPGNYLTLRNNYHRQL